MYFARYSVGVMYVLAGVGFNFVGMSIHIPADKPAEVHNRAVTSNEAQKVVLPMPTLMGRFKLRRAIFTPNVSEVSV